MILFPSPMLGKIQDAVTTWNPTGLAASITLSNGNLRAAGNTGGTFANVQGTTTRNAGKWYLEVKNVLTQTGSGGIPGVAFVVTSFSNATFLSNGGGTTFLTYGEIRSDTNSILTSSADTWGTANDILCLAVDLDNRKVYGRKVGGTWNANVSADPATNTGGLAMGTNPGAGGAAVTIAAMPFSTSAAFDLNTGQSGFSGSIPSGFAPWG